MAIYTGFLPILNIFLGNLSINIIGENGQFLKVDKRKGELA